MAGDIAISWNMPLGRGDWRLDGGDLAQGAPIVSAVLVALFSDARAPAEYRPQDGSNDPRGHWSDSYTRTLLGSDLWQYERAKKAGNTNLPVAIKRAAEKALQPLKDSGAIAEVTVQTGWLTPTTIALAVTVTEPDGTRTPFKFSWAWDGA